jgi:hypothetical protein
MGKILPAVFGALMFVGTAEAALVDRGGGMIYDTDRNITWLQNWSFQSNDGRLTWDSALAWASSLVYGGFDDWRLPSTLANDPSCAEHTSASHPLGIVGFGMNCTGSEMGHLWYDELGNTAGSFTNKGPFINMHSDLYWSADRAVFVNPPTADGLSWVFTINDGYQGIANAGPLGLGGELYAVAVRTGDVAAPVPEPETYAMMLAGLGLVGTMARRRTSKSA